MTKVNNIQQTTSTTNLTNPQSRSIENTLLLCLFVIGILGTMYFFRQAKNVSTDKAVYFSSMQTTKDYKVRNTEQKGKNYLHIFGLQEQGYPLEFAFDNLEEHADYQLDFGDGKKINLIDSQAVHAYAKSGTFQVKLVQKTSRKGKILQEKTIRIASTAQLVDAQTW